jgi:hypothetical protein
MILKSLSLTPSSYTTHLFQGLSSCCFPIGESLHEFLIISHVQRHLDSCPEQRVEKLRLDIGGTGVRLSAGTVISVFSGSFFEVKEAGP